jgi:hypothetical protein
MAKMPTILSLSEFLKIEGKHKAPVIIYFDEKQWANLTRGMKPVEGKAPEKGVSLALSTLPGLPGGFAELHCPFNDPFTGKEGEVHCGKQPPPLGPGSGGGGPITEFCLMAIRKDGSVICSGKCNTHGQKCTVTVTNVRVGLTGLISTYISCGCR